MSKERIKTNESPAILIDTCEGDLTVRGWAEAAIEVKGDYQVEESAKGYRLVGQGGLRLSVPGEATLTVDHVGGDLVIRHLAGAGAVHYIQGDAALSHTGDMELGTVHGDLVGRHLIGSLAAAEINGDVSLRGVRDSSFTAIHGDLSARLVDGHVSIESIHGDADLRTINGDVTIRQGFRDVNLTGVGGTVNVAGVTGDVRLRGGLESGDHALAARGDIVVRWPAALPLNLVASGAQVDNRIALEDVTEKKGSLTGHIGKGDTNLTVAAAGRVIVRPADTTHDSWGGHGGEMEFDVEMEMAGMAARIEAEVNSHLARVSRDMETRFGADFGQRMAERMARKADKAADHLRRRMDTRGRSAGPDFNAPPGPPPKPASTAEQLHILKMVESGKISPEEAGMLLEALES